MDGNAHLAGTLEVVLVNNVDPPLGSSFTIFTAGALVGTFDTITGLTLPGNKDSTPSYDATSLTLVTGEALLAATTSSVGISAGEALTEPVLETVVQAALARWQAVGLSAQDLAGLGGARFRIAELSGSLLGVTGGDEVLLDRNAGGQGWFIDSTPWDDVEFDPVTLGTNDVTSPSGRTDLLSVVLHEMGHLLGAQDLVGTSAADQLMAAVLGTGQRRRLTTDDVARVFALEADQNGE